ncbi:HNH endonuclease [Intrasporangium sp. YIM S08009]|uniref:HNH endonuclease n=1 Tax=Intrasporangium zincisolvens TaxID=3080018 RepID=UPI002B0596C5|nr:DUF222 domain-containing protein [Intrasporangium sp. YIM S08009]
MFDDVLRTAEGLASLVDALRAVDGEGSDADRVDQLAALERVKAAVAAAQSRVTVAFVESQAEVAHQWRERARECSAAGDFEGWRAARDEARLASVAEAAAEGGVDAPRRARRSVRSESLRSVAGQVALARRESPVRGSHHVRLALRLLREMPETFAALERGDLSEWRASIVARETEGLDEHQRRFVDAAVAGRLGDELGSLGNRELVRRVRAAAYVVEPASVLARSTQAQADRRVTIRPAPDTMAYVTALLPVAQAVATHAALTVAADSDRAAGDDRTKGQVMADELVVRVTGQERAEDVAVEVHLVMTDRALFWGDDVPGQLPGYGPVPAAWARRLLVGDADPARPDARSDGTRSRVWLRRLYADPSASELVAMESMRRTFDGGLRRFLVARDGAVCRTPWCDAPIRHVDHVEDHASGGPTSAGNGQGLCVRCNHTKQLPGWKAIADPTASQRAGPHRVVTMTPTGHRYESLAPPLVPGHARDLCSALERHVEVLLLDAA